MKPDQKYDIIIQTLNKNDSIKTSAFLGNSLVFLFVMVMRYTESKTNPNYHTNLHNIFAIFFLESSFIFRSCYIYTYY